MTDVTITVRTIDGGNVEVEEMNIRKTYGQTDVDFVAALLDKAAAKVRAAYGLPAAPTPCPYHPDGGNHPGAANTPAAKEAQAGRELRGEAL